MTYVRDFFIIYFVLIAIAIIMYANSILKFRRQKRISICVIAIISCAILLSIFEIVQKYGKDQLSIPIATVFSVLCYVLRPVCVLLFIVFSGQEVKNKSFIFLCIPLLINTVIYTLALFPGLERVVFCFVQSTPTEIAFEGGYLRFTSHIISALYLTYLVYISVMRLKKKHLNHAVTILICAFVIVFAVLIETFFDPTGEVHLLNSSIAVSTMIYYLFIYTEKAKYDTLTGLFNRETYYQDLPKMEDSASAVVQFDLNGLKHINDTYGHLEGDKAISTVAKTISKHASKNMYAYRLGGDEFILLAVDTGEEEVFDMICHIRGDLIQTNYSCSIGYSYRKEVDVTLRELFKEAEQNMYKDKDEFYQFSAIKRRKDEI